MDDAVVNFPAVTYTALASARVKIGPGCCRSGSQRQDILVDVCTCTGDCRLSCACTMW
jgi:hypothetical protein